MDRRDCVDRLDFHDNQVLHQQIHAIAEFELDSVIDDGQTNLGCRPYAGLMQFMLKTGRVSAFQKSRA